jgi:predicted ATPase
MTSEGLAVSRVTVDHLDREHEGVEGDFSRAVATAKPIDGTTRCFTDQARVAYPGIRLTILSSPAVPDLQD